VTARLFLAPLLCLLQGRNTEAALAWRSAPLSSPLPACGARETFHRAALRNDAADVLSFQDSSAQKALAQADVLVRQRANSPAVAAGELVEILDF
jgi:molybdopterin molybdotransferase